MYPRFFCCISFLHLSQREKNRPSLAYHHDISSHWISSCASCAIVWTSWDILKMEQTNSPWAYWPSANLTGIPSHHVRVSFLSFLSLDVLGRRISSFMCVQGTWTAWKRRHAPFEKNPYRSGGFNPPAQSLCLQQYAAPEKTKTRESKQQQHEMWLQTTTSLWCQSFPANERCHVIDLSFTAPKRMGMRLEKGGTGHVIG